MNICVKNVKTHKRRPLKIKKIFWPSTKTIKPRLLNRTSKITATNNIQTHYLL